MGDLATTALHATSTISWIELHPITMLLLGSILGSVATIVAGLIGIRKKPEATTKIISRFSKIDIRIGGTYFENSRKDEIEPLMLDENQKYICQRIREFFKQQINDDYDPTTIYENAVRYSRIGKPKLAAGEYARVFLKVIPLFQSHEVASIKTDALHALEDFLRKLNEIKESTDNTVVSNDLFKNCEDTIIAIFFAIS